MSPLRAEIRKVTQLALPVVGATVGTMLMGAVDTAMVGRVSREALAAASLGGVWVFGTFLFFQGVLMGMDPIVSHAHGRGDPAASGRALQQGVVLALVLSVPMGLLWAFAGDFLALAGQDPALAAEAHRYVAVQIPSAPFLLVFVAVRQYLLGRELMRPPMWVVAIANVFNALFNYALVFGHLGMPELGLFGAGIATSLTRVLMCLVMVAMVWGFELHEGAWVPWGRASFAAGAIWRMGVVGVPVAVQMAAEIWAFSASTLIAGLLGATALGAHHVTLNVAAFAFMFPMGVSQGAATRVGNLLGAGRPEDAQRAAWITVAMGGGVMAVFALGFVVLRSWLPRIYTPDLEVIAASAAIFPIAAAFAVFDGVQVVACGVLRGMGNTAPAARYNLLGYWALGLPVGSWLALRGGAGLAGIWWGLALGLATVALLLVRRLSRRGPATQAAGAFPH
jgi:MATE family multidrug resistance protein